MSIRRHGLALHLKLASTDNDSIHNTNEMLLCFESFVSIAKANISLFFEDVCNFIHRGAEQVF